jgi:uncharacterized protein
MTTSGRGVWARIQWAWDHSIGWVLMWALILPIRAYQRVISPLTPPSCRFHPSCSAYAVGSIQTHGALKGLILGTWRLIRCNPWNSGGLDPVPAKGHWLPDVLANGEPRHGTIGPCGPSGSNV